MRSWNETVIDWVNLPPENELQSLWICLHDVKAISIESNLLEQYLIIELDAFFMPDDVKVIFRFDEVDSVRVTKYPPPYQFLITDEMPWQERNEIASKWESKWREESMSWQEFEQAMATDPLDISDADLVTGGELVAFRMCGHLNGEKFDDLFCSVFIRASRISVTRSDREDFSLNEFIETGGKWWDSFGSQKKPEIET